MGVIFTMTSSFQKGSKNISFEKGGLQRKHKFKNRNFKSNKTSFGSKPKRLLSLKLHTSFKKLGLKDSTLEKKGRNLRKFNLVSNTRNSRFEDSFGFMKLSVLEGRLPAKFKNSVSKIYKIKERIFDPVSGEEANSFAGLKNLILEESEGQERLSVFLEEGFTPKKSKILGESSNLDKVLLRPSSFIDNNQEEEERVRFIGGFLEIPKNKYIEKNKKLEKLRAKIESEINRSLPFIVDIEKKFLTSKKSVSTVFYYKSRDSKDSLMI